jgi:hypothetical protein
MWEIAQTVILCLVFLMICSKGLMMTDIYRNMRHYKEITKCIARHSCVHLCNWLNLPFKRTNRDLLSWNLHYAVTAVTQLLFKPEGLLLGTVASLSVWRAATVLPYFNKHHAITPCIGWPSHYMKVSIYGTSEPAPLLLRESCWVAAGIIFRTATRAGLSGDKMSVGG